MDAFTRGLMDWGGGNYMVRPWHGEPTQEGSECEICSVDQGIELLHSAYVVTDFGETIFDLGVCSDCHLKLIKINNEYKLFPEIKDSDR